MTLPAPQHVSLHKHAAFMNTIQEFW